MRLTKNAGIAYDLKSSPYSYTVENRKYYFSSRLHVEKFEKRIGDKEREISTSLSNRFNIWVDFPIIAEIILYQQIEKRGFLIEILGEKGGLAEWPNQLKLSGARLTLRKPGA